MAEQWIYTYTPLVKGNTIGDDDVARIGPAAISELLAARDGRFDVGLVGQPATTAAVRIEISASTTTTGAPLMLRWHPADDAQPFSGFAGIVQLRAQPDGWTDLGIVGMCHLAAHLADAERVLTSTNLLIRRLTRGLARRLREHLAGNIEPEERPPTRALQVSDVMSRQPLTVPTDMDLRTATMLLLEHRYSAAPVTDRLGRLAGVVSTTDLLPYGARLPFDAQEEANARPVHTVAQVMSRPALTTTPQTPLRSVITVLRERDIGRLVVTSGDQIVGIVSRHDVLKALARWSEVLQHAVDERLAQFGTQIVGHVRPDGTVLVFGQASSPTHARAVRASIQAIEGVTDVEELVVTPETTGVRQHTPRHTRRKHVGAGQRSSG